MTRARLALAMLLGVPAVGTAAELRCPATLTVEEKPDAPSAWTADPARVEHPFERIEVLTGAPGEERKEFPASLVPDDEKRSGRKLTQTWRLATYRRDGVVLVCRYRGTSAALASAVPADVAACEQTVGWDAKKGVTDVPGSPPTMICR